MPETSELSVKDVIDADRPKGVEKGQSLVRNEAETVQAVNELGDTRTSGQDKSFPTFI